MDEIIASQTPLESSQIDRYLGDIYVKAVTEINNELSGKRPFKCGWFEKKVMETRRKKALAAGEERPLECLKNPDGEENRSDDEEVDIFLKDGREFRGTWGEAKKWLAENDASAESRR